VNDTLFNSILQQPQVFDKNGTVPVMRTSPDEEYYRIDDIVNKLSLHFPMTQSNITNTTLLACSERYTQEEFDSILMAECRAQRWKPYTSLSHLKRFLIRFGPFNSGAVARIEQFARIAKQCYHGSLHVEAAITMLEKEHEKDPQRTHYLVIDATEVKRENRTSVYSLLFWAAEGNTVQKHTLWQCALSGSILVQESPQKVYSYDSLGSAIKSTFPKHCDKSHAIPCWHYEEFQTRRKDMIITEGIVLPDI